MRLKLGHRVKIKILSLTCESFGPWDFCNPEILWIYQNLLVLVFRVFPAQVKLGFDFPRVTPNQKSRPRSLKFDFDEERNPIPDSLKKYSYVKSPNFPHQKLKMHGIEFRFDRKMRPSMESHPSTLLLMDCGERPKN